MMSQRELLLNRLSWRVLRSPLKVNCKTPRVFLCNTLHHLQVSPQLHNAPLHRTANTSVFFEWGDSDAQRPFVTLARGHLDSWQTGDAQNAGANQCGPVLPPRAQTLLESMAFHYGGAQAHLSGGLANAWHLTCAHIGSHSSPSADQWLHATLQHTFFFSFCSSLDFLIFFHCCLLLMCR